MTVLAMLPGCGGGGTVSETEGREVELRYASNLQITEHEGFTEVKIRNPWDTLKTLQTYVLVESGGKVPEGYSSSQVVRVPLQTSVVYSAVHNSLINELGASEAISGVCDKEYIYEPELAERISKGDIADCGNSMQPNVERIISIKPGAVLLSPFATDNGHGKLDRTGIPVVECADYMETSPLGRAEWMRFYGRLYGKGEKADSLFEETEREYLEIKGKTRDVGRRPKVLMDRVYGQSWNLPAGESTMGRMIEDAGGRNPYSDVKESGSLQLSPEKVVYDAGDADYWFIRFVNSPMTLESLGSERPLYTRIKAYKEGNVYVSDTSRTHIFEEVAFHPQLLLSDMVRIMHPEVEGLLPERGYFTKIK